MVRKNRINFQHLVIAIQIEVTAPTKLAIEQDAGLVILIRKKHCKAFSYWKIRKCMNACRGIIGRIF